MNKNTNKPNSSPAPAPQQPKVTPASAPQQPKATQGVSPQPIRNIPGTTKPTPTATPTHDDIAKRAFEIYTQKGSRQDSEQNWKQAEQELKK
jgi:hypothetical protein